MPSPWRWCPNCRRWFYPESSSRAGAKKPRCPVCQHESVAAEDAPGKPPAGGEGA